MHSHKRKPRVSIGKVVKLRVTPGKRTRCFALSSGKIQENKHNLRWFILFEQTRTAINIGRHHQITFVVVCQKV